MQLQHVCRLWVYHTERKERLTQLTQETHLESEKRVEVWGDEANISEEKWQEELSITAPEINFQGLSQNLRHGRLPHLMHSDLDINLDSCLGSPLDQPPHPGWAKALTWRRSETGDGPAVCTLCAQGAARIRAILTFSSMTTTTQPKLYF